MQKVARGTSHARNRCSCNWASAVERGSQIDFVKGNSDVNGRARLVRGIVGYARYRPRLVPGSSRRPRESRAGDLDRSRLKRGRDGAESIVGDPAVKRSSCAEGQPYGQRLTAWLVATRATVDSRRARERRNAIEPPLQSSPHASRSERPDGHLEVLPWHAARDRRDRAS